MNKLLTILTAAIVIVFLFEEVSAQGSRENVKLAQTGMQFLSVVSDARAAALGNSVTTIPMGSSSLFFNPATMSESKFLEMSASINQWIADIKHNTLSLSVKPSDGDFGVFGVSFQSVDYGEIIGTIVDNSRAQGYTDFTELGLSNPNPTGLAIGFGYAIALNTQFSVGGQTRYVHQDLGSSIIANDTLRKIDTIATPWDTTVTVNRHLVRNRTSPLVFDFGTSFKTGFKSLVLGMSIRNFSTEIKYASESFELPLTFNVGVSMDMMDFFEERDFINSVFVSADAVHNRDYHEQIFLGAEVSIMKVLALRGGYVSNSDENNLSFGFGVSQYGFIFDYAYTPFGIFDKVQRFSMRFSM